MSLNDWLQLGWRCALALYVGAWVGGAGFAAVHWLKHRRNPNGAQARRKLLLWSLLPFPGMRIGTKVYAHELDHYTKTLLLKVSAQPDPNQALRILRDGRLP